MNLKLLAYAGIGLALISSVIGAGLYIRENERVRVREEISRANEAAEKKADVAKAEVNACYRNGGVWHRATGSCK